MPRQRWDAFRASLPLDRFSRRIWGSGPTGLGMDLRGCVCVCVSVLYAYVYVYVYMYVFVCVYSYMCLVYLKKAQA